MGIDRMTTHTGAKRQFPQSSAPAVALGSDPKTRPYRTGPQPRAPSLAGRYPRDLLRQVVLFRNACRMTCCCAIVHERRVGVPGHLAQMCTHRVEAMVTVEPLVDLVE